MRTPLEVSGMRQEVCMFLSLCLAGREEVLREVLDVWPWLYAKLLLQRLSTVGILTQGQSSFPLAQIALDQSHMGLFSTWIDGHDLLPVMDTLLKSFAAPGNLCQVNVGIQIGYAQRLAAKRAPIAVKR